VQGNQSRYCNRKYHDVKAKHLAKVEHVEERTHPKGIDCVLGVDGNSLGVEVLLYQVASESRDQASQKDHDPYHPGGSAAITPASGEELAPEVKHHKEEEHLGAPKMEAVEEVALG
jgi:hypothetical protein